MASRASLTFSILLMDTLEAQVVGEQVQAEAQVEAVAADREYQESPGKWADSRCEENG